MWAIAVEGVSGFAGVRTSRALVAIASAFLALVFLTGCAAEEPSIGYSQDANLVGASADAGAGLAASAGTAPADTRLPQGATSTVRMVFAVPIEGETVVLSGRITELLADHDFILDDGTGAIYVDGDDDCSDLCVGDALFVTGVVDVGDSPFRVEIKATAVTVR